MGELEETPVIHAVISDPTSSRTGGEICLSNFGENATTLSTKLCMEVIERDHRIAFFGNYSSLRRRNTTSFPKFGEQPTTPILLRTYNASNAWSNLKGG